MEQIALSVNDTSRLVGIGRTKIYELIKLGQLGTFRIGRRRLILREDVEALVQRGLEREAR